MNDQLKEHFLNRVQRNIFILYDSSSKFPGEEFQRSSRIPFLRPFACSNNRIVEGMDSIQIPLCGSVIF